MMTMTIEISPDYHHVDAATTQGTRNVLALHSISQGVLECSIARGYKDSFDCAALSFEGPG